MKERYHLARGIISPKGGYASIEEMLKDYNRLRKTYGSNLFPLDPDMQFRYRRDYWIEWIPEPGDEVEEEEN